MKRLITNFCDINKKLEELENEKQENLISGKNIKTINSVSLLGEGNIEIGEGGTFEQKQSDWEEEDELNVTYIKNKPNIPSLEGYATQNWVNNQNFLTEHQSLENYAKLDDLPEKVSQLTNDAGYITSFTEEDPVFKNSPAYSITNLDIQSWNNKSDFSGSYEDLSDKPDIPSVPTNVSEFNNDAGYLTQHQDISNKYDKTGGTINGNVEVVGDLKLKIPDEDYDAGVNLDRSLDTNLGTILSLNGYVGNTSYKVLLRNIASPINNNDAVNKKYVDNHILVPNYYLIELNIDGSVKLKSSTLTYQKVYDNLTNPSKADYLDVLWETENGSNQFSRFYVPCIGIQEVNNGDLLFQGNILHFGVNYMIVFTLNQNDILTTLLILPIESNENKKNSVIQNSTSDAYYPTTKAVFNEFQRKPDIVWEYQDGNEKIKALNVDISDNLNWQITGLNLTPYKRLKFYITGGISSNNITPNVILEMSLDPRSATSDTFNNYTASGIYQYLNNSNRLYITTMCVNSSKNSVLFLKQNSLYGTAATSAVDDTRYLYLIEGYYD